MQILLAGVEYNNCQSEQIRYSWPLIAFEYYRRHTIKVFYFFSAIHRVSQHLDRIIFFRLPATDREGIMSPGRYFDERYCRRRSVSSLLHAVRLTGKIIYDEAWRSYRSEDREPR